MSFVGCNAELISVMRAPLVIKHLMRIFPLFFLLYAMLVAFWYSVAFSSFSLVAHTILISSSFGYYLLICHWENEFQIIYFKLGKKIIVHFGDWSGLETRIFHSYLCERFRGYSSSLFRHLCLSLCLHLWCSAISWHFLFRTHGIQTLI